MSQSTIEQLPAVSTRKIALVGTSCTYKSAILEHFKKHYENDPTFGAVEEAARLFFSSHEVEDRFSEETQGRVQDLAMQLEHQAHLRARAKLLTDRSVIDAPAYVRAMGDVEGSRRLVQKVGFWLPSYHKILLLDPVDVPYEPDEVRTETVEERNKFHEGFLDLFQESGIAYSLVGGTLPERIAHVEALFEA